MRIVCVQRLCDPTQRITCCGVPRNEQRRRPSDPLVRDGLRVLVCMCSVCSQA